jgi:hypothetical protein
MLGLVALDIVDAPYRRWWAARALTADTVAGILVLLVTVLVVNQMVLLRQVRDRSAAVSAQAAILMIQALNTAATVSAALKAPQTRSGATDDVRTYLTMLLVAAPVLIDDRISRYFLEQAQALGGVMARALTAITTTSAPSSEWDGQLAEAAARLRQASDPLLLGLDGLDLDQFLAPRQNQAS